MGCELPTAMFLAFIRQLFTLAIYVSVLVAPWLAMIGTFRSSLGMLLHDWRISILVVQTRDCTASGLHWHQVGIILFASRYPHLYNFNTTILVDIVEVKSLGNSPLNPPCVFIWVSIAINKHNSVAERIVPGRITVLSLFSSKPYVLIEFLKPA